MIPALPARSFCLIRHGETTANRDEIIAGSLDVPLTVHGRAQATSLTSYSWEQPLALFTSPLSRAVETTSLAFPDAEFTAHPGLRERDWGHFEGRPLAELPPREGRPEGGEDWAEMIARVAAAITECCRAAGPALPVLICHSGVIRASRLLSGQGTAGTRPPNAQPIHFIWTGSTHKEHFDKVLPA